MLPAASAINSRVQSASAASLREARPGAEADSGPERNSAAQSPESASAATSGAAVQKMRQLKRNRAQSAESLQKAEKHLFAAPVCSSAGQSAASPPTAAPCRRCVPVAAEPGGTHLPAETKVRGTRSGTGNSQQGVAQRTLWALTSSSVAISIAVGGI